MDRPNKITDATIRDLEDNCAQAQAGIDLLGKCGCTDDLTAISEDELTALGHPNNLQQLMASPQLLIWWNALRRRVV